MKTKYDIGYYVKYCSLAQLQTLEPLCNNIVIEESRPEVIRKYIAKNEKEGESILKNKIHSYQSAKLENEILVFIDGSTITHEDLEILKQLPTILDENGGIPDTDKTGVFQLGTIIIQISNKSKMV